MEHSNKEILDVKSKDIQVDFRKRNALKKLAKLGAVSGAGAIILLTSTRKAAAS
jgi:hypothetical protein